MLRILKRYRNVYVFFDKMMFVSPQFKPGPTHHRHVPGCDIAEAMALSESNLTIRYHQVAANNARTTLLQQGITGVP
jgi:hypothetical protein